MSRVGKKPVLVPAGVTAKLDGHTVAVKGAKGELTFTAPDEVDDGGDLRVVRRSDADQRRAQRLQDRLARQQLARPLQDGAIGP